jgi:hypothetical protein
MKRILFLYQALAAGLLLSLATGCDSPTDAAAPIEEGEAPLFQDGETIALRADNGLYVHREPSGEAVRVDAIRMAPWTQFVVTTIDTDRIALKADNGLYLSRINRGVDLNPVEASKTTPDVFSQFVVTRIDTNRIALKADNGLYLSRIVRISMGAQITSLEAAKTTPDVFSQFTIVRIGS